MELLREVQPTTFCGIPWVWDRMLDSLKTKHLDSTAFRRRIDRWAMRMGLSTNKRRMMGCGRRWTGAQGAEPGVRGRWDLGAVVTCSASSTALLLKGDPPATVLRPGQEIDLRACQEVPGSQPLPAVSKRGHGAAESHAGFLPQSEHPYHGGVRLVGVHGTAHAVQPPGLPVTEVGLDGPLSSLGTAAQSRDPLDSGHLKARRLLSLVGVASFSLWCGAGAVMEVGPRPL